MLRILALTFYCFLIMSFFKKKNRTVLAVVDKIKCRLTYLKLVIFRLIIICKLSIKHEELIELAQEILMETNITLIMPSSACLQYDCVL